MDQMNPGHGEPISVADHERHKTRVLSRQCDTCVFHPGNPMRLAPGRLRAIVDEALARQRFIVCHDTLPYGPHPGYRPAVCRGFYDRYDTQALHLARRLWGIAEVPPPPPAVTDQPAVNHQEPATATAPAPPPRPPDPRSGPLVYVDVDGVLNPDGSRQQQLGFQPHRFDTTGPHGQPARGTVWLHPQHGTWPVVDLQGRTGTRWGHAPKLDPITAHAGDTPLALLDDQIGGKDPTWAQQRTADGSPTLLIAVDPYKGLTRADIDQVLTWLPQAAHATTTPTAPTPRPEPIRRDGQVRPCPCECNRGGLCGGCGHHGCGGTRPR